MADFELQMKDYRLTTAQILYHMPDHGKILQEFIWQDYDIAPQFPNLYKFLDFWEKEIDGKLHSVFIAKREIITSSDYRMAEWMGSVQ